MRQSEIVLRHIEEYGHITSWEAMQEYGINQLHPIIADLRKAGIPIKQEMISQKNRYGDGNSHIQARSLYGCCLSG